MGCYGQFDSLSYRVRTGVHVYDDASGAPPLAVPALSTDLNYVYSRRFDISAFANRELDVGPLTGERVTDAYGGIANVHPMLRGTLAVSHDWQVYDQPTGRSRVMTSAVDYRHLILGWLEPHAGLKFTAQDHAVHYASPNWPACALEMVGAFQTRIWDYYHEDRKGNDFHQRHRPLDQRLRVQN